MRSKHCSDEQLLCHLDGESAPGEDERVELHLKQCWICRRRLAEIESQIHRLTRIVAEADLAVPPDTGERLRRLEAAYGSVAPPMIPPAKSRWLVARPLGFALASAACAAVSFQIWTTQFRPTAPVAPRVKQSAPAARVPEVRRPVLATLPRMTPLPSLQAMPVPDLQFEQPDLERLEAEVRYAIHRIDADMEDPPLVRREGGELVVECWCGAEAERERLAAALREVSYPALVRLAASPMTAQAARVEQAQFSEGVGKTPDAGRKQLQKALQERAGSREALLRISNHAMSFANGLLDAGYALERLRARYPETAALDSYARRIVQVMEADYLAEIEQRSELLRRELEPLFPSVTAGAVAGSGEGAGARSIRAGQLVIALFAGGGDPALSTLEQYEDEMAREFSKLTGIARSSRPGTESGRTR